MIALGPKSSFSRLSQIESYSSGPTASVVDDLPGRKVKRLLRAGLEPATIGGSRCPFRECSPSTLYQLSYPGDWGKSILLGGRLVLGFVIGVTVGVRQTAGWLSTVYGCNRP